jgi:hypothetical protein
MKRHSEQGQAAEPINRRFPACQDGPGARRLDRKSPWAKRESTSEKSSGAGGGAPCTAGRGLFGTVQFGPPPAGCGGRTVQARNMSGAHGAGAGAEPGRGEVDDGGGGQPAHAHAAARPSIHRCRSWSPHRRARVRRPVSAGVR